MNRYGKLKKRLKKQKERKRKGTAARGHSIEALTPNISHKVETKGVVLCHVVQREFTDNTNILALCAVSDQDRTTASFAASYSQISHCSHLLGNHNTWGDQEISRALLYAGKSTTATASFASSGKVTYSDWGKAHKWGKASSW